MVEDKFNQEANILTDRLIEGDTTFIPQSMQQEVSQPPHENRQVIPGSAAMKIAAILRQSAWLAIVNVKNKEGNTFVKCLEDKLKQLSTNEEATLSEEDRLDACTIKEILEMLHE